MNNQFANSIKPDALLLIATHCAHCHSLALLLKKAESEGSLGALKIINVETSPEQAREFNVRSVPWLRLGQLEFSGSMTAAELDRSINQATARLKHQDVLENLLLNGKLLDVINAIDAKEFTLSDLMPLLEKTDAKINVRIGIGAVLEHFEGTDSIRAIIPLLTTLTQHMSAIIRADACHYLTLTHDKQVEPTIKALLSDEDPEVREIARESLESDLIK